MTKDAPRAGSPAERLWSRARTFLELPYLVVAVLLLVAIVVLGDEIGRHIHVIDAWIRDLGPWGVVVFVLLYAVFSSMFVPDLLFGIMAGATFGFGRGLLAVAAGSLLGAALQYALARRLLKHRIEHALRDRPAFTAILAAVRGDELRLQALIRLTPLNRAFTSYTLGAAGVGFARFELACLALLPSLCLEVYSGVAGRHLAHVAGESSDALALHDAMLVVGLAVAIAVVAVLSRTARRALDAAAARSSA